MNISENGIQFICQYEGFKSSPYQDSGGVWTIGYGTICYSSGISVTGDDSPISEAQGIEYLDYEVNKKCSEINDLLTVDLNQNQYDAICSFTYNLGIGALKSSTLLKLINQSDFDDAANQFPLWDHDDGKVLQGLLNRRNAEKALFLLPC